MTESIQIRFTGIITVSVIFLTFLSCSHSGREFDKMNWLEGNWENKNQEMRTVESWKREKGRGFLVKGFMLENNDTVFSERIIVTTKEGSIYYTATVPDQNNGEPVAFKLTANTGKEVVFENPEHDFPQKITYRRAGADSVRVSIAGKVKKEWKKQEYYLVRSAN